MMAEMDQMLSDTVKSPSVRDYIYKFMAGGWNNAHGMTQPMSDGLVIVHATGSRTPTARATRAQLDTLRATQGRTQGRQTGELR